MKATTNKLDPMERRMLRGRKIARSLTLAALVGVGTTAVVCPELFLSKLSQPTEEEREAAKKERKKKRSQKPKSRLSKKDIERLAKLRESRARKHLIEILVRLEKRILIAEAEEAATTAKFREEEDLFPSLQKLMAVHGEKLSVKIRSASDDARRSIARGEKIDRAIYDQLSQISRQSYQLVRDSRSYSSNPNEESLILLKASLARVSKELGKDVISIDTQAHRYLKSLSQNIRAIETQDNNLAVRGFAQPGDHPLTTSQRVNVRATCKPMPIEKLHELSQDMAAHYTNLMGDVEAGELAEAAQIPFPEALDKLAHQPFAKDDLQDSLKHDLPENMDQLDKLTDSLNEAKASAERGLKEAGGEVPGDPGEGKPGEGEPGEGESGEGGDKSGDAEEGDGPFGSGGGDGSENSSEQGPPSARGQMTKEEIWRSLAIESQLAASQDRTRHVSVDSNKVLANVLPGRRFTADSPRKGYLFIDTWHIIGPWDATVNRGREIDYSRIYPPETKLDLDAVFTTGKTSRLYDDERGYAGKSEMDGRLTWQFYQSPTVEVRIPREQLANDALYFAYTEVFFEEATTMNLAIGSDDSARIRVNGEIVFQDSGLSPYVIAEQVRQVKFKQGINNILVRLVNGPGPCRFSLLLTASE